VRLLLRQSIEDLRRYAAQEAVADVVFAVQADVTALFAAPKLGDALAAAAYHPTDAVVRKLWAQCENILDRSAQVNSLA